MKTAELLNMRDYLLEVVAKRPRYKFRMNKYQDHNFDADECHTAGCAIGHAIFDGLVPNWLMIDFGLIGPAKYYKITPNEALGLFGSFLPNNPKTIAKGIRKFIARKVEAGED